MSIQIPSDATFASHVPRPKNVIVKLPREVQERMRSVAMPVQYEEAVKALEACASIDEGKFWSDKADALAAWAKIYKSDEAAMAARRLKLIAFRKMGEIAERMATEEHEEHARRATEVAVERIAAIRAEQERIRQQHGITPGKGHPIKDRKVAKQITRLHLEANRLERRGLTRLTAGSLPGADTHLKASGLSRNQVQQVARVKNIPTKQFSEAVRAGISVSAAGRMGRGHGRSPKRVSDAWLWLATDMLNRVRNGFHSRNPHEVAAGIARGEVKQARALAVELIEWLDAFEQALPK